MIEFNVHKLNWRYVYTDHSSTFDLKQSPWRTYHSTNNWVHRVPSLCRVDLLQCEIAHSCRLPPGRKHQPNTNQWRSDLPKLKTLKKGQTQTNRERRTRYDAIQNSTVLHVARRHPHIQNYSEVKYRSIEKQFWILSFQRWIIRSKCFAIRSYTNKV